MFVRLKERSNGKTAIQIVECHRIAGKAQQKVVRHLGQGTTLEEIQDLKKVAETIITRMKETGSQPFLPLFSPEQWNKVDEDIEFEDRVRIRDLREQQRIITGIVEVFGKLYSDLGLDALLYQAKETWHSILRSCVLARLANPSSKRRTAALLEEDYGVKIPLHKIYRMMDRLHEHEDQVKEAVLKSTLSIFQEKVEVLFFDVTTLYFESIEKDDLRSNGFSKDCKFKETQVVLALVSTTEGMPITYELFPGNTFEGHTLITMIESLEKRFKVANVTLVADRAMFNEDNLILMESKGIKYIVAAKLRSLPKDKKAEILASSLFMPTEIEEELHWVNDFNYKNRRLVVSYSSARAQKDLADRTRLIERLLKKVKNEKVKVQDVISNRGTTKFLKIESGVASVDQTKISEDARWDGLHGVITNLKEEKSSKILSRYRGLWQIEEAFRLNKHDLKMRPIFHWTEDRIRSHISICFLAFCLAKQATHRIRTQYKKMSFDEIRNHLLHVQASITIDRATEKKYVIPSHSTPIQKRIYSVFGLKLKDEPTPFHQ